MNSDSHCAGDSRLGQALRRLPLFHGKTRLVDAMGRAASRWGGGTVMCEPVPGARMQLELNDRIQRQMWGGCFEPHVRRCLEALLKEGGTLVDVGAHIGYHSAVGAAHVGPQGRVFAFEPDPALHQRLAQNLAAFPWAVATQSAVWETTGRLVFERSYRSQESGWGILTTVRNLGQGEQIEVEAISIDDWAKQRAPTAIGVMKIDAEGAEPAILRGARHTLERFRPTLVLEVNQILLRSSGSSAAAIAADLNRLGYRVFSLGPGRILPWSEEVHEADALCIPDERLKEVGDTLRRGGIHVD